VHRELWVSAALIAAAVALVGGCSCSFEIGGDSLDRAEVEDSIADGLEAEGPRPETVSCPDAGDVEVTEGETFTCMANDGEDLLARIAVTLAGDEGEFSWRVVGDLDLGIVARRIAESLTAQVGQAPRGVDCPPSSEIELAEGELFECAGTAPAGDEFAIEVTLTDDTGTFDFVVPEEQFGGDAAA
jgi:hypothetical protein